MNPTDLHTRLRQIDPAADLDRDSGGPAAARLLARARGAEGATPTPRRRRRRTVVALAAALTIGSSAAVASGIFQPDPADIDTILDAAADAADVHLPGWRPSLRAETVECHYSAGQSISTPVSDFPLDEALTREHITAECTSGNDMAGTMASPPDQVRLCAATITPEAYRQRLAERGEPLLDGDVAQAAPVFTVALGWATTCGEANIESPAPLTLRPLTDADLDRINRTREVEVSLRAAARDQCLSRDEALAMADQARDHLDGEWPLVSGPGMPAQGSGCHQVWVDEWGLLSLQGR